MLFLMTVQLTAQTYPPQAGQPGSTAIHKDSPLFVAWATGATVVRGYKNISNPALGYTSTGMPSYVVGPPNGEVVSLGDAGHAIVTFAKPISNGPGFDFAVFENGSVGYLELATVEVSSDGINFFKFPTHSKTSTETQIGMFGTPVAENLNNIAGKYIGTYGTPFDLEEIPNNKLLDKSNIRYVKVIDVVGSIDLMYGTTDSFGNMINDSFPTPFDSGGFDLQAVGVLHQGTAATDSFNDSSFQVHPNPFSEVLYFDNSQALPLKIKIYDSYGRIHIQTTTTADYLNTSSLASGLYYVEFQKEQQKIIKKMIKK